MRQFPGVKVEQVSAKNAESLPAEQIPKNKTVRFDLQLGFIYWNI